jgi:predicted secreted protein
MRWTSFLAIYFLFWFLCLFVVLPFGVRTTEETGAEKVPGQADSAPHEFRPVQIILRTSLVAAAVFLLFYLNYVYGWVTIGTFDGLFDPPRNLGS